LIVCTGVGLLIPLALLQSRQSTYVASMRLLVAGTTDKTGAASAADTVAAIATSRTQMASALRDIGVDRDPDAFVHGVSARAIGTSGIVELSVTGEDRVVAAALANALTARVVHVMRDAKVATYPLPTVIDSASPSTTRAVPPFRSQDVALGALLGLILGVGIAALMEAFNPTVVGEEAIAAQLGAPVLGVLPGLPRESSRDLPWVQWQLGAQAKRTGVATVELATAGPSIDLLPLRSGLLRAASGAVTAGASRRVATSAASRRQDANLKIRVLDRADAPQIHLNGATGLVVVAPTAIKRTDMEAPKDLLRVTGWPAVGVIAYRPGRLVRLFSELTRRVEAIRRRRKSQDSQPKPRRSFGDVMRRTEATRRKRMSKATRRKPRA